MASAISNLKLRALPLPLIIAILTQLGVFIGKLQITDPFWSEAAVLLVLILSYSVSYLTVLENEQPTPVVTIPPTAPAAQAVVAKATQAATSNILNPAPAPKPNFVFAIENVTAKLGDSVTYSVSGATPNNTWQMFDKSNTPVTGKLPTDADGNGSTTMTLDITGVIGDQLSQDGKVALYAVDTATQTETNEVTLT